MSKGEKKNIFNQIYKLLVFVLNVIVLIISLYFYTIKKNILFKRIFLKFFFLLKV